MHAQVASIWPQVAVVQGRIGVDKVGRRRVSLAEHAGVKAHVDGRFELLFEIVGIPLPRRLPRTVCLAPEVDQRALVAFL
ncbi:hypothetical protein D3C76_1199820 [compost metagenome]